MKIAFKHVVDIVNRRVVSEIIAFARAFAYRLNRLIKRPKNQPIIADGSAITILVHGYLADSSCWRPWIERFRARGQTVIAVDLGLDHPFRSIDELADRLHATIRDAIGASKLPMPRIRLVGHSMGGLVASLCALRYSACPEVKISTVVTIASPLKGAKIASLTKWLFSKSGEAMAPDSEDLKHLSDLFNSGANTIFHHAAAKYDDLVTYENTFLGSAAAVEFPCNHLGIIYQAEVMDWVEECLK